MSDMSKEQRPVGGDIDVDPTDDHGAAGCSVTGRSRLPRDRSEYDGSEYVGPQDYGAEDVTGSA